MINCLAMCARCKKLALNNIQLDNDQVEWVQKGGTINVIHPAHNSDDDNQIHVAKIADVATTRLMSFSVSRDENGNKVPIIEGCEGGVDCENIPARFKNPLRTES